MWIKKYYSANDLKPTLQDLPEKYKIVYTYGAFDILHPGHIKFLTRARELGDFLIVGVVSDTPIRKLRGLNRPIQELEDRLTNIGSIRCVDAAITQIDYNPSEELRQLGRIDILTKGDDWEYIPGTETVISMGGKLIQLDYTKEHSTSKIVNKMEFNKS